MELPGSLSLLSDDEYREWFSRTSDYFRERAKMIERGEYVPCRYCSTPLSLYQLVKQYEMCEQHREWFMRNKDDID